MCNVYRQVKRKKTNDCDMRDTTTNYLAGSKLYNDRIVIRKSSVKKINNNNHTIHHSN